MRKERKSKDLHHRFRVINDRAECLKQILIGLYQLKEFNPLEQDKNKFVEHVMPFVNDIVKATWIIDGDKEKTDAYFEEISPKKEVEL